MSEENILVGAVSYDPKVVTIWEGIRDYFHEQGISLDYALFSHYERQVDALVRGHIDIAWNTPLAHVRVKQRTGGKSVSICMRDSDQDFHSRVIVRADANISDLKDLEGKVLAVGTADSTQARILPLHFLKEAGVDFSKVKILPFEGDMGKHGDTGNSELEVLKALKAGRAQAGTVGDLIWVLQQGAGIIDSTQLRTLWTSPPFDHCMFDALPSLAPEKKKKFEDALFGMSWDNPKHRVILELEGLKQWVPPREEGYESLIAALKELD